MSTLINQSTHLKFDDFDPEGVLRVRVRGEHYEMITAHSD